MKKLQQKVQQFNQKNMMLAPIEHRVLDTVSELGEVAKEILKMTDYGKKSLVYNSDIKGELGDVFYSLIGIANHFDINLEEALNQTLKKYNSRLEKGNAGSENE